MLSKCGLHPHSENLRDKKIIVDTGCKMTTMSYGLFGLLGIKSKEEHPVIIKGLNGPVEKSSSLIIPYFELGGINIGPVRVALSKTMRPEFKDTVLLGMNIMMWFEMKFNPRKNYIELKECRLRTGDKIKADERFIHHNPTNLALLVDEEVEQTSVFSHMYSDKEFDEMC
jgi:hypothetical protein